MNRAVESADKSGALQRGFAWCSVFEVVVDEKSRNLHPLPLPPPRHPLASLRAGQASEQEEGVFRTSVSVGGFAGPGRGLYG